MWAVRNQVCSRQHGCEAGGGCGSRGQGGQGARGPGGRLWVKGPGGRLWVKGPGGRLWVKGPGGRLWVKGPGGRLWVKGPGGRLWVKGPGGRLWVKGPGGRLWVKGPGGRLWVKGPGGRLWVKGPGGRLWVKGPGGRLWVKGPGGRLWVKGPGGRLWVKGPGGRLWVKGPGGRLWVKGPGGRLWVRGSGGRLWVRGPGGRLWVRGPGGRLWSWTAAVRNVHGVSHNNAAPSDATGPDIPFARALLASGTSQRVGIIPMAAGGTNLFNNWMPENNAFFDAMINQTRRAMAAAAPNVRLRGMLMMLGEGDAMTIYNWNSAWNPQGVMWSYSFNSLMTRLITAARARLAQYHPLLPVAISLQAVTGRDRVYPYISVIREQTQAMQLPNLVKADMEGCAMYDVDFSSFNGYLGIYGWVGQQAIHLSRAGQCCMAQRFADAYLAALPTMNTTAA
ncbi:SGNH hydrolase-type esterase domain-containing protein [Haematococcus lacustris]